MRPFKTVNLTFNGDEREELARTFSSAAIARAMEDWVRFGVDKERHPVDVLCDDLENEDSAHIRVHWDNIKKSCFTEALDRRRFDRFNL